MTETKPWYLSRTIWASAVAIALSVAGMFGASTAAVDSESLIDAMLQGATAIAAVVALLGRIEADKKIG